MEASIKTQARGFANFSRFHVRNLSTRLAIVKPFLKNVYKLTFSAKLRFYLASEPGGPEFGPNSGGGFSFRKKGDRLRFAEIE